LGYTKTFLTFQSVQKSQDWTMPFFPQFSHCGE
jgi:hypothetical protein